MIKGQTEWTKAARWVVGCVMLWGALGAMSTPKYEVRAVWFTTLQGLDWPSAHATTRAGVEQQKKELRERFDALAQAGINVVLFQTRLRATVIYPSSIEPWDAVMTGSVGRAPLDFDPLAFAIEEAHARGMELHAWIVAFPAMKAKVAKVLGKRGLPQRQPHLMQLAGEEWVMNPGVPETADYLAALCREVTERYDIDGIHLDYIRYPEHTVPFNDATTYRRYGRGQPKAAWRRANVTRVVQAVHAAVRSVKPWVKLSCSPIGKYADLTRYRAGGWNARDAVFQEAQRWQQEGYMDWLFPMMYFQKNHFFPFALDWKEQSGGKPIVPGLGIYFLSTKEKDWELTTITRELHFLRQIAAGGQAFFRSRFLTDNTKDIYRFLKDEFYAYPALVPPLSWVDSLPPLSPVVVVEEKNGRYALSFTRPADTHSFNVYVEDTRGGNLKEHRLLARRLTASQFTYAPALRPTQRLSFWVTAVDRFGNESVPALGQYTSSLSASLASSATRGR